MRAWKCLSTRVSLAGTLIASALNGLKLDNISAVRLRTIDHDPISTALRCHAHRQRSFPQSSSASRFTAGSHRSDCEMRPQWRRRESKIEYRIARPRADAGRGGLGCVVHDGTYQSLGKHCESLPAEVRVRPDAGNPIRSRGG